MNSLASVGVFKKAIDHQRRSIKGAALNPSGMRIKIFNEFTMGRIWLLWFTLIARGSGAIHACILSREGCRILAEAPYSGVPVDIIFKRKVKQHCVFPMQLAKAPIGAAEKFLASIVTFQVLISPCLSTSSCGRCLFSP